MTWREKLVVRILLLVAKIVCDDGQMGREIDKLATTIYVAKPEEIAA